MPNSSANTAAGCPRCCSERHDAGADRSRVPAVRAIAAATSGPAGAGRPRDALDHSRVTPARPDSSIRARSGHAGRDSVLAAPCAPARSITAGGRAPWRIVAPAQKLLKVNGFWLSTGHFETRLRRLPRGSARPAKPVACRMIRDPEACATRSEAPSTATSSTGPRSPAARSAWRPGTAPSRPISRSPSSPTTRRRTPFPTYPNTQPEPTGPRAPATGPPRPTSAAGPRDRHRSGAASARQQRRPDADARTESRQPGDRCGQQRVQSGQGPAPDAARRGGRRRHRRVRAAGSERYRRDLPRRLRWILTRFRWHHRRARL